MRSLRIKQILEEKVPYSESKMRKMIRSGEFPAASVCRGRDRMWDERVVDSWIEEQLEVNRNPELQQVS